MNEREFQDQYPALSDAIGLLADGSPHDDEKIARSIGAGKGAADRSAFIKRTVADAHRLLEKLDDDWDTLAAVTHRSFQSRHDAHSWLVTLVRIWRSELQQLKPSA